MSFWEYICWVNVALVVSYGLYVLVLRNQRMFAANRWFLVGTLLFAWIYPVLSFPRFSGEPVISVGWLPEWITQAPGEGSVTDMTLSWFAGLYLVGVFLFALRLVYRLWRIRSFFRACTIEPSSQGTIAWHDRPVMPFSFGRFIALNRELDPALRDTVLRHEYEHIRQYHTWDVLLLELVQVFCWFNPVLFFYKRSLRELHEFQADEAVMRSGEDPQRYQQLIVAMAMGVSPAHLTHALFHPSTFTRRMNMIQKFKTISSTQRYFRYLLWLPVVIALVGLKSCTQASVSPESTQAAAQQEIPESTEHKKPAQNGPLPTFPGGQEALVEYLSTTMKYPKQAGTEAVEGRVLVSFVVGTEGEIRDVRVVESLQEDFDKEAVRVVSGMPAWEPARKDGKPVAVELKLPIRFQWEENG